MARPAGEVAADAFAGEGDELLVVPGATGVMGEGGQIVAARLPERLQRQLVEAAALATEQLLLDGVTHEGVAEGERVLALLDEEAALDEAAQHRDQLVLAGMRHRRQEVELGAPPQHGGGLD